MKTKIEATSDFARSYKRLLKKHRSLKSDIAGLYELLLDNPYLGDRTGENTYKIRLAIKSKGKGKSGGARVFTYVDLAIIDTEEITKVILLQIIDKAEMSNMGTHEVEKIIRRFQAKEEE